MDPDVEAALFFLLAVGDLDLADRALDVDLDVELDRELDLDLDRDDSALDQGGDNDRCC